MMAPKTKPMSQIKEIYRLHNKGNTIKGIARLCGISKNTVRKYLALLAEQNMSLEAVLTIPDPVLEHQLLNPSGHDQNALSRFEHLLDQADYFEQELKRTGVNKWLLWKEYRQQNTTGYSYSQFCFHLQEIDKMRKLSMTQSHPPGDKLFIDFAGKKMEWIDRNTGEVHKVEAFAATLGYSKYSYLEAVASQKVGDFLMALTRCIHFLGGVPAAIVPDNLKSAVIRTDRYEPEINRLLEDLSNHYNTAILPTRSAKPQDKSLVENLVKNAYSHIYAPLRNQKFFSLAELNAAIRRKQNEFNAKPFQGHDDSRIIRFEQHEKHLLLPLPEQSYEIKKYREVTVQKNAHISLTEDKHYYSVPYRFTGQKVKLIYTATTVRIFVKSEMVAMHARDAKPHSYTSVNDHMPSHHRQYLDRSPEYYELWASKTSEHLLEAVKIIIASKKHPEQAYKSCEGLRSLERRHGKTTLSMACKQALDIGVINYGYINRIIQSGMVYQTESPQVATTPPHDNVRGAAYYQNQL
jgi:transposase